MPERSARPILLVLHGWPERLVIAACLIVLVTVLGYFFWWLAEGWKRD